MHAPSINELIAEKLIDMADEPGKGKYQIAAYKKAAGAIRKFPQPITSGEFARQNIAGIGASIKAKIDEILTTGTLQILEQRPQEEKDKEIILREFRKIYGVGPKQSQQWYNWGYRSVDQLAEIYPTMTDAQKLGYQYYRDFQQKVPRNEIDFINGYLHKLLDPLNVNFVIAGSYRRGLAESGDIDMLIENNGNTQMGNVLQPLFNSGLVIGNLAIGETVYRGIIRIGPQFPARRLDIRLVNSVAWPFALLYFTGSKDFNVQIRNRAIALGVSLSEYSLTDQNANSYPAKSEEEIFQLLGVQYLEPQQRTGNIPLTLVAPTLKLIPAVEAIDITDYHKEEGVWFTVNSNLYVYFADSVFPFPIIDKKYTMFLPNIKNIAGFDLDGTLITTQSGGFRRSADDVVLLPNRRAVLKYFIDSGFTIVIFTNQLSRTEDEKLLNYNRVVNAINLINLPMIVFMSTGRDQYRKPATGMWLELLKYAPSIEKGFYCGDAAGNDGDHSDSDLKFAEAIGVPFYSIEQVFKNQ